MMSGVSGVAGTGGMGPLAIQRIGWGRDEFLRLLTEQLKRQNPLDPLESREFIAQLATFSQLEQLIRMGDFLADYMKSSVMSSALSILEKEVRAIGEGGKEVRGRARAVEFKEGRATVTLEGGIKVLLDDVLEVKS